MEKRREGNGGELWPRVRFSLANRRTCSFRNWRRLNINGHELLKSTVRFPFVGNIRRVMADKLKSQDHGDGISRETSQLGSSLFGDRTFVFF